MRKTLEQTGWRVWLQENPAPNGWAADEFDVLMQFGAPTSLIRRIWGTDWRTADKRVRNWKRDNAVN